MGLVVKRLCFASPSEQCAFCLQTFLSSVFDCSVCLLLLAQENCGHSLFSRHANLALLRTAFGHNTEIMNSNNKIKFFVHAGFRSSFCQVSFRTPKHWAPRVYTTNWFKEFYLTVLVFPVLLAQKTNILLKGFQFQYSITSRTYMRPLSLD